MCSGEKNVLFQKAVYVAIESFNRFALAPSMTFSLIQMICVWHATPAQISHYFFGLRWRHDAVFTALK